MLIPGSLFWRITLLCDLCWGLLLIFCAFDCSNSLYRYDIDLAHPDQPLLKAKQLFVMNNLLRKKKFSGKFNLIINCKLLYFELCSTSIGDTIYPFVCFWHVSEFEYVSYDCYWRNMSSMSFSMYYFFLI